MTGRSETGSPPTPHHGQVFRHRKRGTVYSVLGVGSLQTSQPLGDGASLVVYRGQDGRIWVRPAEEFADGRFERVTDGETS